MATPQRMLSMTCHHLHAISIFTHISFQRHTIHYLTPLATTYYPNVLGRLWTTSHSRNVQLISVHEDLGNSPIALVDSPPPLHLSFFWLLLGDYLCNAQHVGLDHLSLPPANLLRALLPLLLREFQVTPRRSPSTR